jgi:hypothetical protein
MKLWRLWPVGATRLVGHWFLYVRRQLNPLALSTDMADPHEQCNEGNHESKNTF